MRTHYEKVVYNLVHPAILGSIIFETLHFQSIDDILAFRTLLSTIFILVLVADYSFHEYTHEGRDPAAFPNWKKNCLATASLIAIIFLRICYGLLDVGFVAWSCVAFSAAIAVLCAGDIFLLTPNGQKKPRMSIVGLSMSLLVIFGLAGDLRHRIIQNDMTFSDAALTLGKDFSDRLPNVVTNNVEGIFVGLCIGCLIAYWLKYNRTLRQ